PRRQPEFRYAPRTAWPTKYSYNRRKPPGRRRAYAKLRKYFRASRRNDRERRGDFDKRSLLSRGSVLCRAAIIDPRWRAGDFRGATFPGSVRHRGGRKSIASSGFFWIQPKTRRDLRNQR